MDGEPWEDEDFSLVEWKESYERLWICKRYDGFNGRMSFQRLGGYSLCHVV